MSDSRPLLLVIDDEAAVLALVRRVGETEGFEVLTCTDGRQGLRLESARQPDLVLVDLRMPDVGGIDIIKTLKAAGSRATVVLMTGQATIDSAVEAVKCGAADYLTKPFDLPRLGRTIAAVREEAARRASLLAADRELAARAEFAGMIGRGNAIQSVFDLIRRLAPHVRTALITGETGTGKELVARALHQFGPRKNRRFVAMNCCAIVETLFESELFGHMRGAFTGATEAKAGLFETADGGILFLDEIGELSLPLQAKLLRVLETGEVQRGGSTQVLRADVRVICATNRDLFAEVRAGRFRTDLLYRLNVAQIELPPLRDRRDDIPYLTAAFIREFSGRFDKNISGPTLAAEALLANAPWPGNIRQLRNVLERCCMLTAGTTIAAQDVEASLRSCGARNAATCEPVPAGAPLSFVARDHIQRTLTAVHGNKSDAARKLGVSRRTLYRLLDKHRMSETVNEDAALAPVTTSAR